MAPQSTVRPTSNADVTKRLLVLAQKEGNRICADCPTESPQWISLQRIDKSKQKLGVFCCSECALHHHFELGKKRCKLKCLKMAHELTMEDLEILEGSGNSVVNRIFEATLGHDDFDKQYVNPSPDAETKRRSRFIKQKYKKRFFFDAILYHEQILFLLQKNIKSVSMQVAQADMEPVFCEGSLRNAPSRRPGHRYIRSHCERENPRLENRENRAVSMPVTNDEMSAFDLSKDIPSHIYIYQDKCEPFTEDFGCKDFNSLLGYEDPSEVAARGDLGSGGLDSVSTLEDSGYHDADQVAPSYYADYRIPTWKELEYEDPDNRELFREESLRRVDKVRQEENPSMKDRLGEFLASTGLELHQEGEILGETGIRTVVVTPQA